MLWNFNWKSFFFLSPQPTCGNIKQKLILTRLFLFTSFYCSGWKGEFFSIWNKVNNEMEGNKVHVWFIKIQETKSNPMPGSFIRCGGTTSTFMFVSFFFGCLSQSLIMACETIFTVLNKQPNGRRINHIHRNQSEPHNAKFMRECSCFH